jgi:3-oxoadipate enol-lactonase
MPAHVSIRDVVEPARPGTVHVERRDGPAAAATPPLVLIGGMTQTLSSWGGQLRPLSATRPVLAYEARGQGATDLSLTRANFAAHVDDFEALLAALDVRGPVDVAGFSFGARLALSVAAARPERVRRLVLTGLGLGRGATGRAIVRAWAAALRDGGLQTLAWVSLPDILGQAYLARAESYAGDQLGAMIRAVEQRNRVEGIRALFEHTLDSGREPAAAEAHMRELAAAVRAPTRVIVGELDRLAPAPEARALADAIPGADLVTVPDVAHTVPIEAPEAWRAAVLEHLDRTLTD